MENLLVYQKKTLFSISLNTQYYPLAFCSKSVEYSWCLYSSNRQTRIIHPVTTFYNYSYIVKPLEEGTEIYVLGATRYKCRSTLSYSCMSKPGVNKKYYWYVIESVSTWSQYRVHQHIVKKFLQFQTSNRMLSHGLIYVSSILMPADRCHNWIYENIVWQKMKTKRNNVQI